MAALANYVHSLGLKFGMYVTPGIPVAAYKQNTPIERTRYHARDIADTSEFEINYNFGEKAMYYIDYRKPGAQEFINSWARFGNGGSVTFKNINVAKTGNYAVTFLYFNGDPSRPATISVNQGAPIAVTFPGTGSFSTLGASTQQLALNQGNNSITISAPGSSYGPDIDSIVIPSATAQYLADAATLVGCTVRSNVTCTDGKCVTRVGMGNTITFKNVIASQAGLHNVTILYLASNARSAGIYVNSGRPVKADFLPTNSSDSNVVGAVSVNLPLDQGVNSIVIADRNAPAPDIDSIIVAE
jgi:hypothetical protein